MHIRILKIVRPIVPNPHSSVDPRKLPKLTEGSLIPHRDLGLIGVPYLVKSRALARLPDDLMEINEM